MKRQLSLAERAELVRRYNERQRLRMRRQVRAQGKEPDDPPEVIEAKFQAAFKQVRAQRLCSAEVRWDSSLIRHVR